jgi:hypothetical protein
MPNTFLLLTNDEVIFLSGHDEKASCIWDDFRRRMGASDNHIMLFNLDDLVQPVRGLEKLVLPFSHEDIDKVVQNMPSDKASRPDGFKRKFLKTCWHIVKNDFYKLFQEFYEKCGQP